jgi:hypothetical protein
MGERGDPGGSGGPWSIQLAVTSTGADPAEISETLSVADKRTTVIVS